jgi:hypothetical protein
LLYGGSGDEMYGCERYFSSSPCKCAGRSRCFGGACGNWVRIGEFAPAPSRFTGECVIELLVPGTSTSRNFEWVVVFYNERSRIRSKFTNERGEKSMSQYFCPARKMFLAAGAVLFVLTGNMSAAQRKPKEPQSTSNQQLAQAIHLLQNVKVTLEAADHDYGGHRAQAVKDIGAAEKQLRVALEYIHKQRLKSGGGGKNYSRGPHPEPQKISDAQLAAAVPTLQQTAVALQNADHDYGGHRARAVTDLKAAIVQLEKALKFSAVKDQNKP